MQKLSEVLGLPVIAVNEGKSAGTLKDLAFMKNGRELAGILVEPKGGYAISKKFVKKENILNFEKDAVTIESEKNVSSIGRKQFAKSYRDSGSVTGLKVFSRSGQELGFVEDFLFDSSTGLIESVELSDGILQDILEGRQILPLTGNVEFSEELIFVSKEAIEEMTASGGGLRKRIEGRNGS